MHDENRPPEMDQLLTRALSHPKRREVLAYLMGKREGTGTSEGDLADAFGLTAARLKYHLTVLRSADLVVRLEDEQERESDECSYAATTAAGR